MAAIDPFELARAEVMLAGYSARWWGEPYAILGVEIEFAGDLVNPETGGASKTFELGGKLDALVRDRRDGRVLVVEHKTSSEDITPGSFYWRRLTLNSQISTYMVGARELRFEPAGILYDVLGKPGLRPAGVPLVDDGAKVVLDASGARVRTKDGKKWRETPDAAQGYVLQTRPETVDEFRDRLVTAVAGEPERYFQRGPVVRLLEEERDAAYDAWQTAQLIREGRRLGRYPRNPDACLQYGSPCNFFQVCTGQASLDDATRYRVEEQRHTELSSDVGRRLPLLSNSEISTYRACARKHHYRYDDGYRAIEESSDAARFGTLVHRGLEHWWLARRGGLPETDCLAAAVEMMRRPPPRPIAKTLPASPAERKLVL